MSMQRLEFLVKLERLLNGIPDSERKEIMSDFETHFAEAREMGKTDDEIVRSLGSVQSIADEIIEQYRPHAAPAGGSGTEKPSSGERESSFQAGGLNFELPNYHHDSLEGNQPYGYMGSAIHAANIMTDVTDVFIESYDGDTFTYRFDTSDPEQYEVTEEVVHDTYNIKVILRRTGAKRFFSLMSSAGADLYVRVPQSFRGSMRLNSNSGDVKVRYLQNEQIRIQLNSGDASIENSSIGLLRADAKSGDVEIENCRFGVLEVEALSGDLAVENVAAQRVRLNSTSGDLELEGVEAEELVMELLSGDLEVRNGRGERWICSTASGDVKLERIAADVEAASASGDVTVQDICGTLRVDVKNGDIRCAVGPETGACDIGNVAGSIDLRIASSTRQMQLEASALLGDLSLNVPLLQRRRGSGGFFEGGIGEGGPLVRLSTKVGDVNVNMD
ncbi:DUF4097 family beta strand repeat-containing protein [Paenibacillus apiarius]|uniref:DUF4097 family beta strand repeat-containing protein n=1 Tax=Paenibacillus apiarius TaxID=46240 RepID=A0ABT4DYK1_9BACL|nr:DUF4097 family beta strand repeat-containing protein [Paenibacillus apiarius]MCY9514421.1 DUF4097 family beta strand repeat-containing protein [Paenibacillus apiarius]MCY9521041.1 DUF4097 family beta strand repeat-containing protein [Paenibacillus apiarius]MCY9551887.1 DUF4097 family beta strand repeat-containing protein [Paenibacillus apiarius]MCY9557775.1 DUF4097 family beta strand repeat-containing protein [Paenibacillus apiarius]MCY9684462.1 DUF4097 family beta strand repeat-containing 